MCEKMRILFIHADYINYGVREKASFAEDLDEKGKAGGMRDPLIAFVSVEKRDEKAYEKGDGLIEKAIAEIEDVASKVKAKNLALFPFAHLSDELASPQRAIEVLTCLECKLRDRGYRVLRVPFGWYKTFELKCKGHPLSVLSRQVPRLTKSKQTGTSD